MNTERVALRCPACELNQFLTASGFCRKCYAPLLATSEVVSVEVQPTWKKPPRAASFARRRSDPDFIVQRRTLAEVERQLILRAIETFGSTLAAEAALGIGKTTLYRKLMQYQKAPMLAFPEPEPEPAVPEPEPTLKPEVIAPETEDYLRTVIIDYDKAKELTR